MPSAEYAVYVPSDMAATIEEYCDDQDLNASEAFREAMRNQLQAFEGDAA